MERIFRRELHEKANVFNDKCIKRQLNGMIDDFAIRNLMVY